MKPSFSKVVIAGLGLMGGSLGMAIRRRRLAREVVGLARRRVSLTLAKAKGAVTSGTLRPDHAAAGADLVVLATPVAIMPKLMADLAPHLPAGCLVTDMGSTKVNYLDQLHKLFYLPDPVKKTTPPPAPFAYMSSHPMAGSEKDGIEAAAADLFVGTNCLLIRTNYSPPEAGQSLQALWRAVGCRQVTVVSAPEHDRWMAAVSHLPHALAACLAALLADAAGREPGILEAVGPGFCDTTRVAGGAPGMWADIFLDNRERLLAAVDRLRHYLSRLEGALQTSEKKRLVALLTQASDFRRQLGGRSRGDHAPR